MSVLNVSILLLKGVLAVSKTGTHLSHGCSLASIPVNRHILGGSLLLLLVSPDFVSLVI